MTSKQILSSLQSLGSASIKNILLKHGAKEPLYGVKVEDLKKVQKTIKADHQQLAMELYNSGVYDAMYLAALLADGAKMSKKELQAWVAKANSPAISEYTVPWVTSESPYGFELAMEWIDSKKELIAAAGWSTLSALMSVKPDAELDLKTIRSLLDRVQRTIHDAPNRVRYVMNGFVIAAGSFVTSLTDTALVAGKKIGAVTIDMNGTACKVPSVTEYINKVKDKGYLGKKKKTAKC